MSRVSLSLISLVLLCSFFSLIPSSCAISSFTEDEYGCHKLSSCRYWRDELLKRDTAVKLKEQLPGTVYVVGDDGITHESIFFPRVDQMTLLEIGRTGNYMSLRSSDTRVVMMVGGKNSTINGRGYSDGKKFVGYYQMVVYMDEGRVTDVEFLESCNLCEGQDCYNDKYGRLACASFFDNPNTPSNDNDRTNMRFYIAWVGSDKKGNRLQSAGELLDRFRYVTMGDIYATAHTKVYNREDRP